MSLTALGRIANNFIKIVSPLKDVFSDNETFKAYMSYLGWNVVSLPVAYKRIADNVRLLIDDAEILFDVNHEISTEEIISLIRRINEIYRSIQSLSDAPKETNVNPSAFLNSIREDLFNTLITDYIIQVSPEFHSILMSLGIIEYQEIEPTAYRGAYNKPLIKLEQINNFLKQPITTLKDEFDWGTTDLNFDKIIFLLDGIFNTINLNVTTNLRSPEKEFEFENNLDAKNLSLASYIDVEVFNGFIGDLPAQVGLKIYESIPDNSSLPGLMILPYLDLGTSTVIEINDDLSLKIASDFDLSKIFGLILSPDKVDYIYPDSVSSIPSDANLGLTLDYSPLEPKLILGDPNGSRIVYNSGQINTRLGYNGSGTNFTIGALLLNSEIILSGSNGDGDGFISKILGNTEKHIKINFGVEWSSQNGFKVIGAVGGGLEKKIKTKLNLGPIQINTITIGLDIPTDNSGISAYISPTINGDIGAVSFTIDGLGLQANLGFEEGNMGPFDINMGFKPPKGIGIRIEGDAVSGGGFLSLDYAAGKYQGAMDVKVGDIGITALGLLQTKLPSGKSGYSLLVVLGVEFTPAIQLGFGFTLDKIGGIAGLHRMMNLNAVRDGVRDGSMKEVMFNGKPTERPDVVLSGLDRYFPVAEDRFVFGPMLRLNWGTPALISLEAALLIQTNPIELAIAGVLSSQLPTKDKPVLSLNVAFIGEVNPGKQSLKIDASIFDSRLLVYTLSGDMSVRLFWGRGGGFLLSAGGFHPDFQAPAEMEVRQNMKRMSIVLFNEKGLYVGAEAYFAVTSNTVQFGSHLRAVYNRYSSFTAEAYIGFDALIYYKPRLKFAVRLSGGATIKAGGSTFAGVAFKFQLEGPGAWRAIGTATFETWLGDYEVDFDEKWGNQIEDTPSPAINVYYNVKTALENKGNWLLEPGRRGDDGFVTYREVSASENILTPGSTIRVRQLISPLDVTIDKYGNGTVEGKRRFELSNPQVRFGGEAGQWLNAALSELKAKDQFAPSEFFSNTLSAEALVELSNLLKKLMNVFTLGGNIFEGIKKVFAEIAALYKSNNIALSPLKAPSFEEFTSGVWIGAIPQNINTVAIGAIRRKSMRLQQTLIDKPGLAPDTLTAVEDLGNFEISLAFNDASQAPLATFQQSAPTFSPVTTYAVALEQFVLVDSETLTRYEPVTAYDTKTEAQQKIKDLLRDKQVKQGEILAIPLHELN